MSCRIDTQSTQDWQILFLENIHHLLFKDKESAGILPIDFVNKRTTSAITIIEGDESSVSSPRSVLSYHTHPLSCYNSEETVWGFPSGEDTTECILSTMCGTIAHVVLAVEGVYVCQVHPDIIQKLKTMTIKEIPRSCKQLPVKKWVDFVRGFILTCVEIYFRTTHGFRCIDIIKKHHTTPEDYLNFCKVFEFSNLFANKEIEGCTRIKCNSVWTYETKLAKTTFKKYVQDYERDTVVKYCTKDGRMYESDILVRDAIKCGMLDLVKDYFPGVKWFTTRLFEHEVEWNGQRVLYTSLPINEQIKFLQQNNAKFYVAEIPYFTFYDISGKCNTNEIVNNLYGSRQEHNFGTKIDVLKMFGSPKCGYCKEAKDKLSKLGFEIDMSPTIDEAIDKASNYGGINISTIPAVFHNKKLINRNEFILNNKIVYI